MPKLVIDGTEHEFENGITLIQACEQAGVEIPRFCYHERLSIAGNCRMCLVEVVGAPKPVASCAMSINDMRPGRNGEPPEIKTNSAIVKGAREGVMEFLLINHPLDCPICDQGGECDLQDQAMAYGVDTSRYAENKRAVEDKHIGPLVKTIMTRCIHCTRCVRFMTEVAGVEELGAIGRGEDMEITTYLEAGMTSELQGNVVDLCPVGALTSKPYAFAARPWELKKTESIDVMDAVGSAIRVDTRGREVMRVMPRNNDDVNEEWISDKSRFIWDGLRTQRLDRPYIREDGKLRPASWDEALGVVADKLKSTPADRIGALAGDLAGVEEMFALKQLMAKLGSANLDCRQAGEAFDPSLGRASYLFNPGIAAIDDADGIMIIGANPRHEAAVLNGRIRKRWRRGGLQTAVIGPRLDLTYDAHYLGAGPQSLQQFVEHAPAKMERPLFLVGGGAYARPDGAAVLAMAAKAALALGVVKAGWNGFGILHSAAARVGALDIGFVPGQGGKNFAEIADGDGVDVIYNLGADEVTVADGPFVIYQGSHGDRGAHRADVILPGATYTEKSATYVNTEGRVQMTSRAGFAPGEAKDDWSIIRAVCGALGAALPFDNLAALRALLYAEVPHMAAIDAMPESDTHAIERLAALGGSPDDTPFANPVPDFYLTNPIARASAVMGELSALRQPAREAAE